MTPTCCWCFTSSGVVTVSPMWHECAGAQYKPKKAALWRLRQESGGPTDSLLYRGAGVSADRRALRGRGAGAATDLHVESLFELCVYIWTLTLFVLKFLWRWICFQTGCSPSLFGVIVGNVVSDTWHVMAHGRCRNRKPDGLWDM